MGRGQKPDSQGLCLGSLDGSTTCKTRIASGTRNGARLGALGSYHLLIADKQFPRVDNGGNDRIRTYDLVLMKRAA